VPGLAGKPGSAGCCRGDRAAPRPPGHPGGPGTDTPGWAGFAGLAGFAGFAGLAGFAGSAGLAGFAGLAGRPAGRRISSLPLPGCLAGSLARLVQAGPGWRAQLVEPLGSRYAAGSGHAAYRSHRCPLARPRALVHGLDQVLALAGQLDLAVRVVHLVQVGRDIGQRGARMDTRPSKCLLRRWPARC